MSSIALAAGLMAAVWFGAPAAQGTIKTLPGVDSSNYYPFDQIDKSNVARLEMAWFYPYAAPTFSPVFADGMLYGLGRNASSLVALDAADRQGALGARGAERHHEQGHQLLGER